MFRPNRGYRIAHNLDTGEMTLKFDKTHLIVYLVGVVLGIIVGFFMSKGIYDRPLTEKVERDTVTIHDTIPDYLPAPKDSAHIKWVTKWLPVKPDTVTEWNIMNIHDTVAVEVPITSKHYGTSEYDAWVSGFEPSLDSILVYQKETVITEVRTISKPTNKLSLDIVGGVNYNTTSKEYTPHIGGELLYKPNRLQIGVRGGIEYHNKVEPVIGGVVKIRIL